MRWIALRTRRTQWSSAVTGARCSIFVVCPQRRAAPLLRALTERAGGSTWTGCWTACGACWTSFASSPSRAASGPTSRSLSSCRAAVPCSQVAHAAGSLASARPANPSLSSDRARSMQPHPQGLRAEVQVRSGVGLEVLQPRALASAAPTEVSLQRKTRAAARGSPAHSQRRGRHSIDGKIDTVLREVQSPFVGRARRRTSCVDWAPLPVRRGPAGTGGWRSHGHCSTHVFFSVMFGFCTAGSLRGWFTMAASTTRYKPRASRRSEPGCAALAAACTVVPSRSSLVSFTPASAAAML
jgi:hypothetical protein